jgi:DNA-binding transcriptional MerR regulator/methylmalonyl-CoA mutase cobalamin-binding subunit
MYTIGEAAARSGVSVPLIRAWERRYGVVAPHRTPAGYRLYDDEAVDRLRAMQSLIAVGWAARQAASQVAGMATKDLAGIGALAAEAGQGGNATVAPAAALVHRFVDAARRVDLIGAEQVLDEAYAATSFELATDGVVLPALVAVGRAWSQGELDVAAEHAASSAVLRRLGAAFDAAGRAADAPVVLVGMPPGAQHEIGGLAVATAARRSGLDAIYLGPNVPVDAWLAAVGETGARAVVLGVVMASDANGAREVLMRLRGEHPGLVLTVGGGHADAVATKGVIRLPEPIADAVATLRRALLGS